jgi:hypothetical protein
MTRKASPRKIQEMLKDLQFRKHKPSMCCQFHRMRRS